MSVAAGGGNSRQRKVTAGRCHVLSEWQRLRASWALAAAPASARSPSFLIMAAAMLQRQGPQGHSSRLVRQRWRAVGNPMSPLAPPIQRVVSSCSYWSLWVTLPSWFGSNSPPKTSVPVSGMNPPLLKHHGALCGVSHCIVIEMYELWATELYAHFTDE